MVAHSKYKGWMLTQVTEIGPNSLVSPCSVQYFSHFAYIGINMQKYNSKLAMEVFLVVNCFTKCSHTFPISTSLHAMTTICRKKWVELIASNTSGCGPPQCYDTTASSKSHQLYEAVVPVLQYTPLHHWDPIIIMITSIAPNY